MNGDNFGGNEFEFLDILTILSFVIGLQNLELNEKQVNSLEQHLNKQDSELLAKIIDQNVEIIDQNVEIIEQNEEIIRLLKEK